LKAVVFDLDDTLYPEKQYVQSGFRAVARECAGQIDLEPEQIYEKLVEISDAGERRRTFDVFLESSGLNDSLAARMVDVYRDHTPTLSPYPGVTGMLAELSVDHRLGIVSDGDLKVQQRKWHALGLERFFRAVVFSDELGRDSWKPSERPFLAVLEALDVRRDSWKPSERPFLAVLEELDVPPGEAVYVGENSLKDFLGARRSGMRTVRVLEPAGYYTLEEPPTPEHAADATVTTLADLVELVRGWPGPSSMGTLA
jgi:putative hydrolase of the HAD superfamily